MVHFTELLAYGPAQGYYAQQVTLDLLNFYHFIIFPFVSLCSLSVSFASAYWENTTGCCLQEIQAPVQFYFLIVFN